MSRNANAIQGVTEGAVHRMARQAGIVRVSKLMTEEVRGMIKGKLEQVLKAAYTYTAVKGQVTINEESARKALAEAGLNVPLNYDREVKSMVIRDEDGGESKRRRDHFGQRSSRLIRVPTTKLRGTQVTMRTRAGTVATFVRQGNAAACRGVIHIKKRLPDEARRNPARKPPSFRPGVAATKEVRRLQKRNNCFLVPKLSFERVIRNVASNFSTEVRISPGALAIIQKGIESWMVQNFRNTAQLLAVAGRKTVTPRDLQAAKKINNNTAL